MDYSTFPSYSRVIGCATIFNNGFLYNNLQNVFCVLQNLSQILDTKFLNLLPCLEIYNPGVG